MDVGSQVRVRYHPVAGIILLVLAILNVALGVMAHTGTSIALGVLFTVISILQLTMPYYVLVDGELQLRNLFGMTVKRYTFDDVSQFEVEEGGKRIFLTDGHGGRQKVRVTRWISHRGDWERFLAVLSARVFD